MFAGSKTKAMLKFWKKYCSAAPFRVRACLEARTALAVLLLFSSVAPT